MIGFLSTVVGAYGIRAYGMTMSDSNEKLRQAPKMELAK